MMRLVVAALLVALPAVLAQDDSLPWQGGGVEPTVDPEPEAGEDVVTTTTRRTRRYGKTGTTTNTMSTTTPAPSCVVTGYYYYTNTSDRLMASSAEDCQEICQSTTQCFRWSFWPYGLCELTVNQAPLIDSQEACVHFFEHEENWDRPCPGHLIKSGPRECKDPSQWPDLRGLAPPQVFTTTHTVTTTQTTTATTSTTTEDPLAIGQQKSFPVAAVVVPLLFFVLLGAGAAIAWKLGYRPWGFRKADTNTAGERPTSSLRNGKAAAAGRGGKGGASQEQRVGGRQKDVRVGRSSSRGPARTPTATSGAAPAVPDAAEAV